MCRDADEPRICYTKLSKSKWEKQILYSNTHIYIWNLEKNGADEPICRAEIGT